MMTWQRACSSPSMKVYYRVTLVTVNVTRVTVTNNGHSSMDVAVVIRLCLETPPSVPLKNGPRCRNILCPTRCDREVPRPASAALLMSTRSSCPQKRPDVVAFLSGVGAPE
jgi:hypothetical protein